MNHFFDILLYINFFVAIPFFIIEIIRFPVWAEKIDITKTKRASRPSAILKINISCWNCALL